jgi:heat shock protein HtpX
MLAFVRSRRKLSEETVNNIKVFVLIAGMTALFMGIGQLLGGQTGALLALVLAGAMNLFMLYGSSKMVLRAYGAQAVTPQQAPELYEMVDRLRQRAGLPMPTVAVAPHAQPNAFATGRNPSNSVVCVTEGLLNLVNRDELEGVIAHELAHIKNRDMLLQTVTATMAGAIGHLATMAQFGAMLGSRDEEGSSPIGALATAIIAPLAAGLIQFAISRQREFKADAVGAEISGKPRSLASALRKLEASAQRIPMRVAPAVAPLAQVNPLAAYRGGIASLFSTHPSTAERVRRLEELVR